MISPITPILAELLSEAGLPGAVRVRLITGRGFDNEVHAARLADGRDVVLRRFREPREPEQVRAAFLEGHGVPAPRLLAGTSEAGLYDFAPGVLLGDLIEAGQATREAWRMVGAAFRQVHDIRFPAGVTGEVGPREIVLRPVDAVAALHAAIEVSVPGLRERSPETVAYLPALHHMVDRAGEALRSAATSLLHGDVNMWNVIVGEDRAWLIDWDGPKVGDPAMEVALLDKHAALFNGRGLDAGFFEGYGRPAAQPNTFLHRVVQTMTWAASSDWEFFERESPTPELRERARQWLPVLLAHVARLPEHLERLRTMV